MHWIRKAILHGQHLDSKNKLYDRRAERPIYKDFDQRVEFWIEYNQSRENMRYVPYYLWCRSQFSGKWHNVDASGKRITYFNADESTEGVIHDE